MTEMNLQLHHVVADVTGATGLRIIRAIIAGERDPEVLAGLRHYSCHCSAETNRAGAYRKLPQRAFELPPSGAAQSTPPRWSADLRAYGIGTCSPGHCTAV